MHEQVKLQIEKKNEGYAKNANKGRKKVIFEPGDWVWVHMRKERFPKQRKSKLQPRGDGPFQVLERINDNAYKLELPGEYDISATFNVADLAPFDVGNGDFNSWTNSFQEGGDDEGMVVHDTSASIQGLGGPMTRSRTKKAKEALTQLVAKVLESKPTLESMEDKMVMCIKPLEEGWGASLAAHFI